MVVEASRPLAVNLQRLRLAAGVGVAELARRSGVARATLTQLESGGGNPTLETLYALANQLGVPLAELIVDLPPAPGVHLVREGDGPRVRGTTVDARLLSRTTIDHHVIEIYAITLVGDQVQRSNPHLAGTREHMHVHSGRLVAGPDDDPVELGPGDYADHPADLPHSYRRLSGTVTATLVITSPSTR